MSTSRRLFLAGTGALASAAALAACGSDDGDEGSGASDSSSVDFSGKGPITYATGKDTSGQLQSLIDDWNKDHPDEEVTLNELPESADDQRASMIQNFQVKSDAFSVVGMDVVWTAEFAANQWVVPLDADTDTSSFLSSCVESATYFDKLYGIPWTTNGNLLYYRKDLLDAAGAEVPTTFDEMWTVIDSLGGNSAAEGVNGYGAQFAKYEGLTVQFAQAVNSAGGTLFDDDGKPTVDTDEARTALQTLSDGFSKGYIPKEALTYKEEESRQAFQDGDLVFLNNWPYVYTLAEADDGSSKVNGKFEVAAIPGIGSGKGVSTLGGLNLGISAFAKNKGTALDFLKYMGQADVQKKWTLSTSQAPAVEALYDDEEIIKQYPFTPTLKESVAGGKPRPQVVKYGDVTAAIQETVYGVLDGSQTDIDSALSTLQTTLEGLTQ